MEASNRGKKGIEHGLVVKSSYLFTGGEHESCEKVR
jgi:hypothetical protein